MDTEAGDDYIRRIAEYIRTHEQRLAAAVFARKRRAKVGSDASLLNPFSWFGSENAAPADVKPVILSLDEHHLFYLLMRMEAVGLDVGSIDVKVESPARPMNYINVFPNSDKSETLSLASFRSSLSAVSRLSLGAGWWGRPLPPSVDAELKYIYSCFTKLPALSLHAPESKLITELANEAPNENAVPLDVFKNLQTLQCDDVDPRTLLGWDRLAEGLRSLTIKRSGLEDVSDIFISAVTDDQARREGNVNTVRKRRHSHAPSRQSSFSGTRLPESVPEDAEDAPGTVENTPKPPSPELPLPASLKWDFLRHLSLSDNALTFLPTTFLPCLTSLTHLDLSSNLLVSVPPGLSALYSLVSLNLSDNMIESVLGIYTMLGQVLYLNLSHNRLESICGLERLLALERVDIRNNRIEESAEVGRLATLPNIAEVWIEGNPFVEMEEGYRIRCFDYFWRESKNILLDGTPPGFYEKQYLTSPPPEQMTSTRPPSVAYSPPVVAVGSPSPVSGAQHHRAPSQASPMSLPSSHPASPHIAPVVGRGRRKKNKRIVDLDGESEAGSSRSGSHARVGSDVGKRTASPMKPITKVAEATRPRPSGETVVEVQRVPDAPVAAPAIRPPPRSRHSRSQTEFAGTVRGVAGEMTSFANQPGSLRKSSTISRAAGRRARISPSVYEPSTAEREEGTQLKEADEFRARIEALRSDMGEGWLKVFQQSQLGSPGIASG
ncbi:hypothetical protein CERSUDRAFT_136476 [Gelatoporia subvermispora B]|uniref:Uncharacterized protein n=1 Tax=Ceriporiopsis subvermispora (strain B) TaxID=914234 RepID=M2RGV7_CERS8|nr:hypothetical protein CERSUDRAFT_136476 [Gelatoporia subvermispora B]